MLSLSACIIVKPKDCNLESHFPIGCSNQNRTPNWSSDSSIAYNSQSAWNVCCSLPITPSHSQTARKKAINHLTCDFRGQSKQQKQQHDKCHPHQGKAAWAGPCYCCCGSGTTHKHRPHNLL